MHLNNVLPTFHSVLALGSQLLVDALPARAQSTLVWRTEQLFHHQYDDHCAAKG